MMQDEKEIPFLSTLENSKVHSEILSVSECSEYVFIQSGIHIVLLRSTPLLPNPPALSQVFLVRDFISSLKTFTL